MLAQFVHGGMIIALHLVGQRQVGRVEDARFAPEKLQQPGSLFDGEAGVGAFAQASVQQQDARRRIEFAQAERRALMDVFGPQRRQMIRIAQLAKSAHFGSRVHAAGKRSRVRFA